MRIEGIEEQEIDSQEFEITTLGLFYSIKSIEDIGDIKFVDMVETGEKPQRVIAICGKGKMFITYRKDITSESLFPYIYNYTSKELVCMDTMTKHKIDFGTNFALFTAGGLLTVYGGYEHIKIINKQCKLETGLWLNVMDFLWRYYGFKACTSNSDSSSIKSNQEFSIMMYSKDNWFLTFYMTYINECIELKRITVWEGNPVQMVTYRMDNRFICEQRDEIYERYGLMYDTVEVVYECDAYVMLKCTDNIENKDALICTAWGKIIESEKGRMRASHEGDTDYLIVSKRTKFLLEKNHTETFTLNLRTFEFEVETEPE